MKKILMLFMLLSCMCVYGEEIIIENTKQVTSKEERIAKKNIWGPYMRELEVSIKNNWAPPKGNATKRVIVSFTISKDGNLLDKKLVKSSGTPLADRAAMNAIQQTAPFKPLPSEFLGQSVPIEFTFDYNVLNSVTIPMQHLEQCKTKFCKFLYSHQ